MTFPTPLLCVCLIASLGLAATPGHSKEKDMRRAGRLSAMSARQSIGQTGGAFFIQPLVSTTNAPSMPQPISIGSTLKLDPALFARHRMIKEVTHATGR